jgi:hypothetical protein
MRVHLLTVLVGALPCGLSNLSGDVTKTKGPEKASYLLGRLVRTRLYVNSSIPPRNDADFGPSPTRRDFEGEGYFVPQAIPDVFDGRRERETFIAVAGQSPRVIQRGFRKHRGEINSNSVSPILIMLKRKRSESDITPEQVFDKIFAAASEMDFNLPNRNLPSISGS